MNELVELVIFAIEKELLRDKVPYELKDYSVGNPENSVSSEAINQARDEVNDRWFDK